MERSAKKGRFDDTLLAVVLILVGIGLVLLWSTSAYNGRIKFHDSLYYLKKQGFATLLGLAGMIVTARIDYHRWIPFSVPGYLTAVILAIAVMLFGDEYNGSKRWLSLGPVSFQPSEFAKVAVILFLAWLVSRNVKKMTKFRSPAPGYDLNSSDRGAGRSQQSEHGYYYPRDRSYRDLYCKPQVFTVYLDGDCRNRIYDCFPCS